ncbi:outer membrane protein [Ekhidna sp.]|uniref:outer membrane protein n=1 Tax=Ekhidna sp. TaxID=2608089 RepID=UPI003B5C5DAF
MKKLIFSVLLITVISFSSQAQKTIGAGLAYGSEIENLGIGINAEFDLNDQIDISPSFIYYFKKNNVTLWELNGNINYIFSSSGPTFYGIAGLNITGVKVDAGVFGDRSDSELGLNLGVGASFAQSGSVIPFAEAKYVLSNYDQLSLFGGVRFPF